MPTLPNRLRQAAQYTGLDSMRELLIEAAGALEGASQPQERKPLTDDEITEGFCNSPNTFHYVAVFASGARFAEEKHGIKD